MKRYLLWILGADDYITKPFGTSELLARIRTAVRHLTRINATNSTSHIFRASGLVIDLTAAASPYMNRRCILHR